MHILNVGDGNAYATLCTDIRNNLQRDDIILTDTEHGFIINNDESLKYAMDFNDGKRMGPLLICHIDGLREIEDKVLSVFMSPESKKTNSCKVLFTMPSVALRGADFLLALVSFALIAEYAQRTVPSFEGESSEGCAYYGKKNMLDSQSKNTCNFGIAVGLFACFADAIFVAIYIWGRNSERLKRKNTMIIAGVSHLLVMFLVLVNAFNLAVGGNDLPTMSSKYKLGTQFAVVFAWCSFGCWLASSFLVVQAYRNPAPGAILEATDGPLSDGMASDTDAKWSVKDNPMIEADV